MNHHHLYRAILEADRSELNNLAARDPQRVADLSATWERLNQAAPVASGGKRKKAAP